MPDKTAYELSVIERIRGVAALGLGDIKVAAQSFQLALSSNVLNQQDQLRLIETMIRAYRRANDVANANVWARRYKQIAGADVNL